LDPDLRRDDRIAMGSPAAIFFRDQLNSAEGSATGFRLELNPEHQGSDSNFSDAIEKQDAMEKKFALPQFLQFQ